MPITITKITVHDIRFPTSLELDGSDAMNPDPDYSAAYVVLHTDQAKLEGHGLTFTIGRGNEICCAAIESLNLEKSDGFDCCCAAAGRSFSLPQR